MDLMERLEKTAQENEHEYTIRQELADGARSGAQLGAVVGGLTGAGAGAAAGGKLARTPGAIVGGLAGGGAGALVGSVGEAFKGGAQGLAAAGTKRVTGWERDEDQSHLTHDAAVGGVGGGLIGGSIGAIRGARTGGASGALMGGARKAADYAATGAIFGGVRGHYRDVQDKRTNAGSVGHEEAGVAQTASEDLMDSLEKTAANIVGGAKKIVSKATGKDYNKYKKSYDYNNTIDALQKNKNTIGVGKHMAGLEKLEKKVGAEKMLRDNARKDIAIGAGGVAAGTAGGAAAVGASRDKKASEDLMAALEKTASTQTYTTETETPPVNLIESLEKTAANLIGGVKNFASNVSGANLKGAKQNLGNQVDNMKGISNQLKTSGTGKAKGAIAARDAKLAESAVDSAKASTTKARTQLAVGAGLAGAGAVAGSAMKNDDIDKTASEDFMSDLYKEAATAILNPHIPEVKDYSDPMDRIKFR